MLLWIVFVAILGGAVLLITRVAKTAFEPRHVAAAVLLLESSA